MCIMHLILEYWRERRRGGEGGNAKKKQSDRKSKKRSVNKIIENKSCNSGHRIDEINDHNLK